MWVLPGAGICRLLERFPVTQGWGRVLPAAVRLPTVQPLTHSSGSQLQHVGVISHSSTPTTHPSFTNPHTSSPLFPTVDNCFVPQVFHLLWRSVLCWLVYKLWFWASWLSVSAHGFLTFSANIHPSLYTVVWGSRCLPSSHWQWILSFLFPVSLFSEKKK